MTNNGTIGHLCLLTFDFNDPAFRHYDRELLNAGIGLSTEELFVTALEIMLDIKDIEEVLLGYEKYLFPEHVPNECLQYAFSLCVNFISALTSQLIFYKHKLYLLVTSVDSVSFEERTSTLKCIVNT